MSIAEKLLGHGVKTQERFWGKLLTVGTTGLKVFGEFEEVDPMLPQSDFGRDPREGSYFNFARPGPELAVNEILIDADGNRWRVLMDREDHPYKPRVRYKVAKE